MRENEYTLLKEAAGLLKEKKDLEAAKLYQKIGEFFSQKLNYHKALAAYKKSLSLSENPISRLSIANIYEKLNKNFSAYDTLLQAVVDFYKQRDYDHALEVGFRLSRLQPQSPYPHEKMAEIYFSMGHMSEAALEFQRGSEKADDPKKSLALLYYAFKMNPSDKNIWKTLREHLAEKDGERSNSVMKIDLLFEKGAPIFRQRNFAKDLSKAKLLLEENLFDDAEKIYKSILEENPQHSEAREAISLIQKKRAAMFGVSEHPSPEEIIRSLEEDLGLESSLKPKKVKFRIQAPEKSMSSKLMYDLAIAYQEMGLYSDAISLLKKALKKTTKNTPFQFKCQLLLGMCYMENRQFLESISLLEDTLKRSEGTKEFDRENRFAFLYQTARAYEQSGNLNKALLYLRRIERDNRKYRDIEDRIKKIRSKIHG